MGEGKIKKLKNADIFLEGDEVCRLLFKTDRITFGLSELNPGKIGDLDPGHSEADEIYFCIQGKVLCQFPEEDIFYELEKGDALLIPEKTGHKLFNMGEEKAIIIWACAPYQ